MTLRLSGTESLGVKTGAFYKGVGIGEWHSPEYDIPMDDFMCAVQYVLTNTDLEKDDPRLWFLEWVKELEIVEGWNITREPNCRRLTHATPLDDEAGK